MHTVIILLYGDVECIAACELASRAVMGN